jgi:hypothetical protein
VRKAAMTWASISCILMTCLLAHALVGAVAADEGLA